MPQRTYTIISSDSHIIEPPDLWTSRLDRRYREKGPRVVAQNDADYWYVGEHRVMSMIAGTQAGVRFEDQKKLKRADKFEKVRPGGFNPHEKVKDMDIENVRGEVVYPTTGLFLYRTPDSGLLSAMCRAYNDYAAEFCGAYPKRLRAIAMVNVDDVRDAVKEAKRAAKMGMGGVMITVLPPPDRSYDRPLYDPLWAVCEDLRLPISLHAQTHRQAVDRTNPGKAGALTAPTQDREVSFNTFSLPSTFCTQEYWVEISIANLIFSGVFERFPNLVVGAVEHEAAWAAHFIRSMDYLYTQRIPRPDWIRFKNSMLPSDFFRRNVFISFQEDDLAVRLRDQIGVDLLAWGTDYPHPEATFPRSQQFLAKMFKGVPEKEQAKVAGGNTARLYGFSRR